MKMIGIMASDFQMSEGLFGWFASTHYYWRRGNFSMQNFPDAERNLVLFKAFSHQRLLSVFLSLSKTYC